MNEFLRMIRMMRYCWICGRYGGGKTTLALRLADALVKSGSVQRVIVNAPLSVDIEPDVTWDERSLSEITDAVLLLDEAGQFLSQDANGRSVRQWFSYLRKRNQIVLMPSVMPVVRYGTSFRCQRIFNGLQMGLPFWLYRWRLGLYDLKDQGWFPWWNPAEVFGLVDTNYEPDGSWYIYDFGTTQDNEQDPATIELGDRAGTWAVGVDHYPYSGGDLIR